MKKQSQPESLATILCSLCFSTELHPVKHLQIPDRTYYHCQQCDLIFMDPQQHATPQAEKTRYEQHQNEPENLGYLQFLRKLTAPLLQLLREPHQKWLDYGCGPNPVLPQLLEEVAQRVTTYDPYFFPQNLSPDQKWNVITSTEVWEHFRQPRQEITKVIDLLELGGFLGVMTQLHQGPEFFSKWWYARDFTHLCFYSEKTIHWLAQQWELEVLTLHDPVIIFLKKNLA